MPRTWEADEAFRREVRNGKVEWALLLTRKNNRKPESKEDHYFLAKGQYHAKGYSLLWIQSTQKAEQDAETRDRHLEQALAELRSIQTRLNTHKLKTKRAIEQAIRKVLRNCQVEALIKYEIEGSRRYERKFGRPGRPKKEAKCKITWKQVFSISFEVDEIAVAEVATTDGIFPLITNLDTEVFPPQRVLEIYKFQPFLEKRHSQLKTWHELTPVLLKKAERVIAYLHMHVMALMVATLIERTLRKAMRAQGIESIPIYPEKRLCPYPTTFDVVRAFRGVERYEVSDGERTSLFPAQLSPLQKQLLSLLEVPLALYQ
jgi:transposase